MTPHIKAFFDSATWTISYIVFDEFKGSCAIIDPVLDYEPKSSRTNTHSADKLIEFIQRQQLSVKWILETHAHADHLSSADYLKNQLGGKTAIGNSISIVQENFKKIFNLLTRNELYVNFKGRNVSYWSWKKKTPASSREKYCTRDANKLFVCTGKECE